MIKLLIVDDDEWILKGIRFSIPWSELGFEIVGEATNGNMAFEMIMSLSPDVVITDIVMPKLNGLELINKVHSTNLNIEFVILSGFAEFSYAREACRLGAFDYLLKPLEEESLLEIVERLRQKYNIMNDLESYEIKEKNLTLVSSNPTLKLILNYIHENYSSKLHLYEVADIFHFNANYISQLFSKELDVSFSEYLTIHRLDMAEKLLIQNNISVKEVCSMVGINDYFYFNKLFKKYKGVTPSALKASKGI